jgi:AcrR family transcriptional regulator
MMNMPTTERPLRRDAERNRRRILAAAHELFAEAGLEVTLDDVAERTGVGVGTVYRRFANKEELIDALFEERIAEFARLAEEALEDRDAWHGLATFLERAAELHATDRGLQQVLFSTAHGQERCDRARQLVKPLIDRIVERAQAAGTLRADVEPTDIPLLQFMLGAVTAYVGDVAPDAWRRQLTILLDGLRVQRRRPTPLPAGALTTEQFERAMQTARLL